MASLPAVTRRRVVKARDERTPCPWTDVPVLPDAAVLNDSLTGGAAMVGASIAALRQPTSLPRLA
jgi:hypothetical protein